MRPRLRVVSPQDVAKVPWYQARWLKIAWQWANALVEFALYVGLVVIAVAVIMVGAVLMALGVGSHFVGGPRR